MIMRKDKKIDITNFTPPGDGFCKGICDKMPIKNAETIKIVCFGCKRVIMEIKNPENNK